MCSLVKHELDKAFENWIELTEKGDSESVKIASKKYEALLKQWMSTSVNPREVEEELTKIKLWREQLAKSAHNLINYSNAQYKKSEVKKKFSKHQNR